MSKMVPTVRYVVYMSDSAHRSVVVYAIVSHEAIW